MSLQNITMYRSTTIPAILKKVWDNQMLYEAYLRNFDKLLNKFVDSKSLKKEVMELLKSASTFDRNGNSPITNIWIGILDSNHKKAGVLAQYALIYALSLTLPSTIKRMRIQLDKDPAIGGYTDKYYIDLIENNYPEFAKAVKDLHRFRYKSHLINIGHLTDIAIRA